MELKSRAKKSIEQRREQLVSTPGGWGRDGRSKVYIEMNFEPSAVLRPGNQIDVIFSAGQYSMPRQDRDYFKGSHIVLEEKRIGLT